MKISRIDVIGQNDNDGDHYEGVGAEWLIKYGLIDAPYPEISVRIYNSGFRGACRTERCEQIDAMGWIEKNHPERYALTFHVPNEIKAGAQYMQMRAKCGVKPGVADIIDCGLVRGAFELKRQDASKSKLSSEQREFLECFAASGGFAAVCYGFEEFKRAYGDFLVFVKDSV